MYCNIYVLSIFHLIHPTVHCSPVSRGLERGNTSQKVWQKYRAINAIPRDAAYLPRAICLRFSSPPTTAVWLWKWAWFPCGTRHPWGRLDTCCWNGLVSKTPWNRALSFAFQPTMMNVKGRVCEYRFSCAAERVVDLDWFDPLSRPAAGCTLSPPLPDYSVDCVMLWFDLAFPLSMPTNEDDAVIMVAWDRVLHVG